MERQPYVRAANTKRIIITRRDSLPVTLEVLFQVDSRTDLYLNPKTRSRLKASA